MGRASMLHLPGTVAVVLSRCRRLHINQIVISEHLPAHYSNSIVDQVVADKGVQERDVSVGTCSD